jgi:tetrahydromethanopterin S-methyltransferase subunit B
MFNGRGLLFYRLLENAVRLEPIAYDMIVSLWPILRKVNTHDNKNGYYMKNGFLAMMRLFLSDLMCLKKEMLFFFAMLTILLFAFSVNIPMISLLAIVFLFI